MSCMNSGDQTTVLRLSGLEADRGLFHLGPVNLDLEAEQMLCVVGPNGAGKTSLLDLVAGDLCPSAGHIHFEGARLMYRSHEHLHRMGLVPDDPGVLIDELTAAEYWRLVANVHAGRDRTAAHQIAERALEHAAELHLERSAQMIATFSHGMRKKTQIAAAFAHQPSLLVIDELRNGLDPIASRRAEQLVERARAGGAAILLATHDLYWAERFADTLVVLSGGRVVAQGPINEVKLASEASLEDAFFRLVDARP